jgi:hypothetical protein
MSSQMNKDEMRNARLRALGVLPAAPDSSQQLSRENGEAEHMSENLSSTRTISPVSIQDIKNLKSKMFIGGGATEEDLTRWYNQGFSFCHHPTFGLRQGNGGPCGILAATQAEIIKKVLFSENLVEGLSELPVLNENEQCRALSSALVQILDRSREGAEIKIVELRLESREKPFMNWSERDLFVSSFSATQPCEAYVASILEQYHSDFGCILFLIALILTR